MGKKKSSNKIVVANPPLNNDAPLEENGLTALERSTGISWPDEFLTLRNTLFVLGAIVFLSSTLWAAAWLNGFIAVKESLATLLELRVPQHIYGSNNDLAAVLWLMATLFLLGLIHPALGIGLLLILRAWLDGYTFPLDNIYFAWGIWMMCGIWAIQLLRVPKKLYLPPPIWIFAGIIVWLHVTAPFAYQYYNTHQMLWLWLSYALLFLLCLNTLRDPKVAGLLLIIYLGAMGAQALFSILHFEYLLPHLRKIVQNPAVLRSYFNTDTITPEMARRFMMNRAFGSMLFPNALAAYLILGIPFTLVMTVPYFFQFKESLSRLSPRPAEAPARDRIAAVGLAMLVGIGAFIALQFITYFPVQYRDTAEGLPVYLQKTPLNVLTFAGAVALAVCILYLIGRWGIRIFWIFMKFLGTALLLVVLSYALWITFSRGAWLSLIIAFIWAGLLYIAPTKTAMPFVRFHRARSTKNVLMLLLAVLVFAMLLSHLGSQEFSWSQPTGTPTSPTQKPGVEVKEEGITLTMSDITDPASFKLRIGYWKVTLRMALDNLLWGVGIGNYSIAYPTYQRPGESDVREAHNGYLQFFAETGMLGGLLFASFWLYFLFWGAKQIVLEANKTKKLYLLSIYTGLVAFCLHAGLDINFSHPSLMMFAMFQCGLFYGRSMPEPDMSQQSAPSPGSSVVVRLAVSALLAAIVVGGLYSTWGVYTQQLALNRLRFINLSLATEGELNKRMRAGLFFFKDVANYAILRDRGEPPKDYPRIPLSTATLIVDDLEVLAQGCTFYRPIPEAPGKFARIEKGEPIPPNGLAVVIKPWLMRDLAIEPALQWIEELKRQDQRFPYNPDTAMHLAKWYEAFAHHVHGKKHTEKRPEWIKNYAEWTRIFRDRNPRHGDVRMYYGTTLVWLALDNNDEHADTLLKEAKQEFELMLRLLPNSPWHRGVYANSLDRMAAYYDQKQHPDLAQECRAKAEKLRSMV